MDDVRPDDGAGPSGAGQEPPPHLEESVRRVAAAGRETFGAGRDTARALRRLVGADLALARGAVARALPWAATALVFAFSTWLMLLAVMVTALHAMGLGWLASTSISAVISLAATALAGWRVTAYLKLAGMQATRRQLSRFGLFADEQQDHDAADPQGRPEGSST